MADFLTRAVLDYCRERFIEISAEARFGLNQPKQTLLEAPLTIRPGLYEIDAIGGFTHMGGMHCSMRHVATIGRFCSIANNVVCGQIEHPVTLLSSAPLFTNPMPQWGLASFEARNRPMMAKASRLAAEAMAHKKPKIRIGNDVWIGEGVFIRRGISIGDGAVVAARSVVTADVPPYAIVGGVPARVIRYRFEPEIVAALLETQWWAYGLDAVEGADFSDLPSAIRTIERNIAAGAEPYVGTLVALTEESEAREVLFDPASGELFFPT